MNVSAAVDMVFCAVLFQGDSGQWGDPGLKGEEGNRGEPGGRGNMVGVYSGYVCVLCLQDGDRNELFLTDK